MAMWIDFATATFLAIISYGLETLLVRNGSQA